MSMTLQQLRVLVAVVEHRSFTRGAQAVFMTQSAASQHVRALEHSLRSTLLERVGGEVQPTHAGKALVEHALEILRICAGAERAVNDLRDGATGRIVLGACGSAVYLVPTLAAGFRAAYPSFEVTLDVRPRAALRAAVAQGTVDVALMSAPAAVVAPAEDLEARPLCPDRLVLAVSPSSPLLAAAALAPYPLGRLTSEPLVAGTDSSTSWRMIERWAAAEGVELRPALRLENADAIKKAVEAGMGIAFLSAWVVEREVALGTLRVVPVDPAPPARHFELVTRRALPVKRLPAPTAPLDAFLRFAPPFLAQRVPPGTGLEGGAGQRALPSFPSMRTAMAAHVA